MKPRIKVCGVRRVDDAQFAAGLGATYIGCVLASDSPRCATLSEIRAISGALDDSTEIVLVFRNASVTSVLDASKATGITSVQPHGMDAAHTEALRSAGCRVLRVYSIAASASDLPEFDPVPTAEAPAVLDVGQGGSGTPFDWQLLGENAPDGLFIAGGISPDNVAQLLAHHPFGIDVSSGVESAPGIKDHDRLRRLFDAVEDVHAT